MIINGEEKGLTKFKIPKELYVISVFDEKIKTGNYQFCLELVYRYKLKGFTVTASNLKKKLKLTDNEIEKLNYLEVDNPYYKCTNPMKLYLIEEIYQKLGIEAKQLVS